MKTSKIFTACASLALALGYASCDTDHSPKFEVPDPSTVVFTINTPPLQDQYYNLTEGHTFELTCSQPNWGYAAIATYSAEVAITPDFATFEEIPSIGSGHTARMRFNDAQLAEALCKLYGFDSEDNYKDLPAAPVYFRAVAEIDNLPESRVVSNNVVSLNKVKFYLAIPQPGCIYLVGAPQGWKKPSPDNKDACDKWRLFESQTAIGSKVYSAVFDIPAGQATFRFYTALTGWDADSYGIQEADEAKDVEFTNGEYQGDLVKGKGSYSFPGWPGGKMTLVVDMSTKDAYTVQFQEGAHAVIDKTYIYLIGNASGAWIAPEADNEEALAPWRLVDNDGSGIFTGTFEVNPPAADGGLFCRFYQGLAGWGKTPYSASEDGSNVPTSLGAAMPMYMGEGCFEIAPWPGGKLSVVLDTNKNTVTFDTK